MGLLLLWLLIPRIVLPTCVMELVSKVKGMRMFRLFTSRHCLFSFISSQSSLVIVRPFS